MLLKSLHLTSLICTIAVLVHCADHGTFKNCSRVEFCTKLRSQQPNDVYIIDGSSILTDNFTLNGTLQNQNGGPNLTLTLSQVNFKIFRIQISETNSTRYQLKDVLIEQQEPNAFHFQADIFDGYATITAEEVEISIQFSPFSIELSLDGTTEIVFDGQRLSMAQLDGAFSFGVKYPQAVQLYGIPSHCDSLALQNTGPGGMDPYRLKNLDVAYYELNSPMALYGSVPVLYGHGYNSTSGVFLHNAAEQWIDINNSSAYFMVEAGSLDLFVLLGPTPKDVVRQYTSLTGTAHMPPLWALGYHQSRYSYATQDDVLEVISNFDSHNFPLDAIWLDIDYTDGYKYFTWNPVNFSDPLALQKSIAETNKKLVVIIDPHVKLERGYVIYDNGIVHQLFVKNPDGTDFQGACWPGLSSYLDYLNPDARQLIVVVYSYYNFPNSTSTLAGIWNDMNEPSVFDNSLEMTLPPDSLHYGNVKHHEIHNLYGFLQTMATHQGLLKRDNSTRRPFILTRSHFAGSQRFAAIWTGDNSADWQYLAASYQQCLTSSIAGIAFCGADVGGFFGTPSEELLQRWYQAGAWLPFFRAHSTIDVPRREPYLFSEEVQGVIRKALQTRYKYLPLWYTLFFEHTRTGDPLIRPLFYHYPEDPAVIRIDNELLVGRDVLVRPVEKEGASSVEIYFPGDEDFWVSANGEDVQKGGRSAQVPVDIQSIPVYYRGGSIVVTKQTLRPNTVEMSDDGYTIYICLDANNTARGTLYLDDELSFEYRNNLDYTYISIVANENQVTFATIDSDSSQSFDFVIDQIIYKKITKVPEKGTLGEYKNKIHTSDINGKLLKDIKINNKDMFTLKF